MSGEWKNLLEELFKSKSRTIHATDFRFFFRNKIISTAKRLFCAIPVMIFGCFLTFSLFFQSRLLEASKRNGKSTCNVLKLELKSIEFRATLIHKVRVGSGAQVASVLIPL